MPRLFCNHANARLLASNSTGRVIKANSVTTANATTVRARINFPTPMPSANIVVVCHIDSTSSNHYTWTAICAGRTTTYIDLVCLQQDAAPWISGSVGASFVAYCVN